MDNALIVMMKNPVRGTVKTRIAAEAGEDAALNIYIELLRHTAISIRDASADKFIFYSDLIDRNDFFNDGSYKKYVQCSGDLGARMEYAFSIPFKNEYKNVVMIGADCYCLNKDHIDEAFRNLAENDFVIGPASDGGYYLIGMKKWNRWIFHNKTWSSNLLFEETRSAILNSNAGLHLLETLSDIDTVADVKAFENLSRLLQKQRGL